MRLLRSATTGEASAQRTLARLAVILALIAGVLAMHTIASTSHHADAIASASVHSMHAAEEPMPVAAEQDAQAGTAAADSAMDMAACILALLAAALAFAPPASLTDRILRALLTARRIVLAAVDRRPPRPSLEALSISRT